MIEKRITSSSNVEILTGEVKSEEVVEVVPGNQFRRGEKFFMDGKVYVVREELIADNCPMRKIISDAGEEEVLSLRTLQGYIRSIKDFSFNVVQ